MSEANIQKVNSGSLFVSSHNNIVKEHLLHMLSGTIIFVVLGSIAVALDAAADAAANIPGVSHFTHNAIEITAHVMLVVDLSLFATYLYKTIITLFNEILK